MVQGQVFLKDGAGGGGADTPYLIFSRFIIFTFIRKFFYPLPLQNCVMHLKKNCFLLPP